MSKTIQICGRTIGPGHPCYIIAEMSANHGHNFEHAVEIVEAAKASGADAIKLQTYTPETLTIDCDNEYFRIGKGSIWEGKNLFQLYGEAFTPWEWQPKLFAIARDLGLDCFSTPFDPTAVDFLEAMGVPAHKIASFEFIDLPLIQKVAATGKPTIMSTGMATFDEITDAVNAFRQAGGKELALLKCHSAYPAAATDMNLRTIAQMALDFGVPIGLSDHTLDITVPVTAVAVGACIIEKHFSLSRAFPGPDSAFSLEPKEFRDMVQAVRTAEAALGSVQYRSSKTEEASRVFRRSLFIVEDIAAGAIFTEKNVRSIRPGYGIAPKFLPEVLGRRATRDIVRGTPLDWPLIS